MQKINWKKLEDINGIVHWVNPQHVTSVRPFNGDIFVCCSNGSPILCSGDGKNSEYLIQLMLDYLSDDVDTDTQIDLEDNRVTMLRAER